MIRVILILLVLIVFLLVSALPLLIGEKCVWKNDENRQKEYALQVVKRVLRMVFRLTGSTLTVKGLENIPDMPVLYVGNHRSYFDIVTGYIVVPGQTGFIAKKEMEKIPLLPGMDAQCELPVFGPQGYQGGLKDYSGGNREGKRRIFRMDIPGGDPLQGEGSGRASVF